MAITADSTPRRRGSSPAFRRALPYLLSLPALLVCVAVLVPFVTAVYYSTAALSAEPAGDEGLHLAPAIISIFLSDSEFWNTVYVSLAYTVLTVVVELLLGLGIAMLLRKQTRINNVVSIAAAAAADDRARHRGPDVEADDQPEFRRAVLHDQPRRHPRFPLGVEPRVGAVHRRAGRHLGLHALHHDPAAGRLALAAPAALRGGRARRRAGELRVLPHHPADADAVHHHRRAVPPARFSIQQFDIIYTPRHRAAPATS